MIKHTAAFTSCPSSFTGIPVVSRGGDGHRHCLGDVSIPGLDTNLLWQHSHGFLGEQSPCTPCKPCVCTSACFLSSGVVSDACSDLGIGVEWGKTSQCPELQRPGGSLVSNESNYPLRCRKASQQPSAQLGCKKAPPAALQRRQTDLRTALAVSVISVLCLEFCFDFFFLNHLVLGLKFSGSAPEPPADL